MMAEKNPTARRSGQSDGEALFNLGFDDGFAGGAYACARCHTQRWSYATTTHSVQSIAGCGALGPSLSGRSTGSSRE